MAEKQWAGFYTKDGGGTPVVLVADGGPVRDVKRALAGQDIRIAAVDITVPENADIKALFAQPDETPQPDAEQAADDVLKAQIRTEIEEAERRKRLEAEVKREMAADKKAASED